MLLLLVLRVHIRFRDSAVAKHDTNGTGNPASHRNVRWHAPLPAFLLCDIGRPCFAASVCCCGQQLLKDHQQKHGLL